MQAIRAHIESSAQGQAGVAGFADPYLSRALTAFHQRPASDWSVAALAREAGLSRTNFAERFTSQLGTTPMAYVTSWRMQIARDALATRGLSVIEAAELTGYASESAFSRVFKKEMGTPPGVLSATAGDEAKPTLLIFGRSARHSGLSAILRSVAAS